MKIRAGSVYAIAILVIVGVLSYGLFLGYLPGVPHLSGRQREVHVIAGTSAGLFGLFPSSTIKSITVSNPVVLCTPESGGGGLGSWVILEVYRANENMPFYSISKPAPDCTWGCSRDYEFVLCLEPGSYRLKFMGVGGSVAVKEIYVPR